MNRALGLAFIGLVTSTAVATAAPPKGVHRMVSVDYTKGGKPVIHDNGVNDGRVCQIFYKQVWDSWIEDYRVAKVKKCHRAW